MWQSPCSSTCACVRVWSKTVYTSMWKRICFLLQAVRTAEDTHMDVFAVAGHILGVPTMYAITFGIPFILHGVIGLHNTSLSRCGDRSPSLQRLLISVFPLSCKINQCYLLLSVWENKRVFSLSTLDAT